jgi:ABC-2 type transport system permease protein
MLALTPDADGSLWTRVAVLASGYLLYLSCFLLVSFAISAKVQSAQTALVALLGFWFLTCFVVPRAATDLAKRLYPTPSAQEFADAMAADQQAGLEGVDYNEYLEARTAELLREYNVETVEQLPFNFAGWSLQTSEEYGNRIFDQHYSALWNRYESQDGLRRTLSVLSPTAAIRSFSMGMAGSDFSHFRHFAEAAEQYRRRLIAFLNADMQAHAGEADFAYLQSQSLWNQAEAFAYQLPSAAWAWGRQLVAAGWLLVWFMIAGLWAWRSMRTMEVA